MLERSAASHFCLVALLSLAVAACSRADSSEDPRTRDLLVRVATARASTQTARSFTGIIAARVQSDLGFRVSGKILERLVDTGQAVTRGQLLMRIDPADLTLAAHAQEESVAAATARARQAAADEARYRPLVAAGAVSPSAYGALEAAAKSASAELNAAKARAKVAGNETSYAALVADADGVVVETLAEPGQVVAAGQRVIRVAHGKEREAVVELPETLRPPIGSIGRAILYGSGLTGPAQLRQLSDAANPHTRTFEARYVLEASLAEAPLGSTVSILIPTVGRKPTLEVPIGAILDRGNGPGVWRIEGEAPRVRWHAVQVAELGDEWAAVTGDLERGDRVVAIGAHLLHEGDPVRLANEGAQRFDGQERR